LFVLTLADSSEVGLFTLALRRQAMRDALGLGR